MFHFSSIGTPSLSYLKTSKGWTLPSPSFTYSSVDVLPGNVAAISLILVTFSSCNFL